MPFDARPTTTALRLLVGITKDGLTLPVFLVITPALQRDRWRRVVALKLLNRHRNWLFSPVGDLLPTHRIKLLGAIGDPFGRATVSYLVRPDGPQVHHPRDAYLPQKVMGLLFALASSNMCRDHLHPIRSFASCDAIMAEEEQVYNTITYFSSWGGVGLLPSRW